MVSDEKLLEILVKEDTELARFVTHHRELDARIADLTKRRSINPQEQVDLQRMKKERLAGRDRIAKILDDYRKNKRVVFSATV